MALNCPKCRTEHTQGDAFAERVIDNQPAFTYFFECKRENCGILFDDTGRKYSSRSDLPDGVS